MFSDRLLQEYCRQIREVEEKMESSYRDIEARLTNPEYRRFFTRLIEDELEHEEQIDTLMNLFTGE
ncbi:MAG: ferritin family protein [Syntrophales bacterium]